MTDSEFRGPPVETAVILAAGFGSRLSAPEGHKILAEIGGRTLFEWHVAAFHRAGVRELVVVTGYEHEELADALRDYALPDSMTVRTALNDAFELSNGLSVLAAKAKTPFWLVMGDHLIDPSLFDSCHLAAAGFAQQEMGGVLAVDYDLEGVFDMPDANKVRFMEGRLAGLGKELDEFDCVDVGLFYCAQPFLDALEAELADRGDCTTSDAMLRLHAQGLAGLWDIGDAWWQDVDTPEARVHAEALVRVAGLNAARGSVAH